MTSAAPGNSPRQTRRVFISSTAIDLRAHRERVRDTLLSLGLFPVGMEHFGAQGSGDASSVSTSIVASADVYLGIIAWRYGYVPAGATRSVTHQEYEEATRLGMPRYIFLADPATRDADGPDTLFPATVRDPEHGDALEAFRTEIGRSHVVDFFTTPEDLASRVATALTSYLLQLREHELTLGVRPPHDLPPRSPEFVGREHELAGLCDLVRRGKEGGFSVAVAGMAGLGKSALAAEAMRVLATDPEAFPGGITWVRCDGRADLAGMTWIYDQLLGAWGISLSPEDRARVGTPVGEVEVRERALRTRLRPSGGAAPSAALVFLDNVERDLPIGRALDVFASLGITALLTARHEPSSPRLRLFALDVLAPDAAIALFAERYASRGGAWDPPRDRQFAAEVVEALGHLPLAIELAAARAARARMGPAALAAELRDADRLGRLRDPLEPTHSVRYAFEQSLASLSPMRRTRFAALGLPDGPDWPRATVEAVLGAVPESADSGFSASDDLDLLAALSLVGIAAPDSPRDPAPRVRMHPLLRELARDEWGKQSHSVHMACLEGLLSNVRHRVHEHRRDFALLAHEEDLIVGAVRRASIAGIVPELVSATIADLDDYLDVGGRWRLGLDLASLQLAACRASGDRRGEGTALNNQGYLTHRLGRLEEANGYYEQALSLRRECGDRVGEGETLNNLGALAEARGRPGDAEQYYAQALAIKHEAGDLTGEAATLNNLGLVNSALGRHEQAKMYYERALALQRAKGDRRGEGTTLGNLGSLASALDRLEEAAQSFEQALSLLRQIGDRAGEATMLNNLGGLSERLGQSDAAREYYEQALAIRRAIGDRRGEGTTLNNLGVLANKLDQREDAARYLQQALAAEREVGDMAGEGATLGNLGLLARAALRLQEARRYFELALPIQREAGDRAGEGMTLNHLGLLAYAQGIQDEAQRAFQRALALFDEIGVDDSARVVRENLAALAAESPSRSSVGPNASAEPSSPISAVPLPAPGREQAPPATPAGHAGTTADVSPHELEPGDFATRPADPGIPSLASSGRRPRRWWPWRRT